MTHWHPPPDTSEHTRCNPSQTGWYSINLPRRDGWLSLPRWLGTYRDGLPVSRQSPIQVVTVPGVEPGVDRDQRVTTTPRLRL